MEEIIKIPQSKAGPKAVLLKKVFRSGLCDESMICSLMERKGKRRRYTMRIRRFGRTRRRNRRLNIVVYEIVTM